MANQNHFELTLDTLAPTGSITLASAYMNANANMTVNLGDASFVKYWFTTSATGTASDDTYPSSWTPVVAGTTTKATEFTTDGIYYYHMQLMDSVDNKSTIYDTGAMNFDTHAPVITANTSGQLDHLYIEDPDSGNKEVTNQLLNNIHFEFSDPGQTPSGVVSYRLSSNAFTADATGTITTSDAGQKTVSISFKSNEPDGAKTVNVYVTDAAGNESQAGTATITLDTSPADATLVLQNPTGHTALPDYINFTGIEAAFVPAQGVTDIVGYKAWLDGSTEPATYSSSQPIALTLPVSDGTKTVHAKVIDQGGNETTLDDASVFLDQTPPVATIVASANIISNVSGHNSSTLTLTGTDTGGSGVASYQLKCGDTVISSANTAPPASHSLTSSDSMVEGDNTITLIVTDNAGNSDSASVTVKLDTTAPTVSIGNLNTWYNAQFNVPVTSSDGTGSGVTTFYAWTSTSSTDETVPSGATAITRTGDSQTISSSSVSWVLAQSATNYMHVKAVDAVGNVNYAHKVFGYDSVAPEISSVVFTQSAYSSTTAAITITYSDATSQVTLMQVTTPDGTITDPTTAGEWEAAAGSRNVTLSSVDGIKKVQVKVKDAAGNESTISAVAQTELDTTTPSGTLTLRNHGTTTAKDSPSNDTAVDLYITYSDDTLGNGTYTITGDFTTSPQSGTITPTAGEAAFTVELTATASEGTKNFQVVLTDNAGHSYTIPVQSFILDTSAPDVKVTGIDYNIVSKVHEYRIINGTETTSYADECHFQFFIANGSGELDTTSFYQAYKVCAYASQALAEAGSHADSAIPTTAGSSNMSATNLNANVAVNAMIKGADLETASSGDGVKIIVVYMQDKGGNWSESAEFAVTQG